MMNAFQELALNRALWACVASWFLAQALKVVRGWIQEGKFSWKLFWELGGMPSSHSSTVSALATSVGIIKGCNSIEFAISCVFAMIVMTDAAGVRRAVGDQAIKINEIVEELIYNDDPDKTVEKIKEILGHTPFQVLMGMLLGIVVACVIVR